MIFYTVNPMDVAWKVAQTFETESNKIAILQQSQRKNYVAHSNCEVFAELQENTGETAERFSAPREKWEQFFVQQVFCDVSRSKFLSHWPFAQIVSLMIPASLKSIRRPCKVSRISRASYYAYSFTIHFCSFFPMSILSPVQDRPRCRIFLNFSFLWSILRWTINKQEYRSWARIKKATRSFSSAIFQFEWLLWQSLFNSTFVNHKFHVVSLQVFFWEKYEALVSVKTKAKFLRVCFACLSQVSILLVRKNVSKYIPNTFGKKVFILIFQSLFTAKFQGNLAFCLVHKQNLISNFSRARDDISWGHVVHLVRKFIYFSKKLIPLDEKLIWARTVRCQPH